MEYDDIITRLRTVYQAGQPIRLVIARTVSVETSTGEVPDINDVSAKCSKICTSHNAFLIFINIMQLNVMALLLLLYMYIARFTVYACLNAVL